MENQKTKKQGHTTHFLIGSFAMLLIISIGAFVCLGYYMGRVSENSIDKVGNVYMAGIKEHIVAHFRTLIDLKFEQVESVVKVVPNDMDNAEELYEELVYRSNVRNFYYLALCAEDGRIEMLDGEFFQFADPDPFFESLKRGEKKVAVGRDINGNEVIIFGVSADYPMKNGEKCLAMAAAVPIEYISTMLGTDEDEDALIYSHIIRKDGSFIVSDMSDEYPDYFSALYGRYDHDDPVKIENYIQDLSASMEKKEDYSSIMNFEGSSQQIYCTLLPYSEWHLLTILPFGVLNETVENMNRSRTAATMLVCAVILVVLLTIFFTYFRITRQQLRDLELAREEALEANKAKSTFLSNMSHDIRTPMNAIVGMTDIAKYNIDDKEKVQDCLDKITASSTQLLNLLNNILDMSEIEMDMLKLKESSFNMTELAENIQVVLSQMARGRKVEFEMSCDIKHANLLGDAVRLRQVLMNIISNGIKYTEASGKVAVSIREDLEGGDSDYALLDIAVEDTGVGMTQDFIDHYIFRPFERAEDRRVQKVEGSGIGMSITKSIIDAMGAALRIESTVGEGSKFFVRMRLKKDKDVQKNFVQEDGLLILDATGRNILVVEDNELNMEIITAILERTHANVTCAWNAEEAVDIITRSEEGCFDLILMDIQMPGMDGYSAARTIRGMDRKDAMTVPIMAMTANAFAQDVEKALNAGMNAHIAKPIDVDELFQKMYHFLCT